MGHDHQPAMVRAIEQTLATLAPRATPSSTESVTPITTPTVRATEMPDGREISLPSHAEPPLQGQREPAAQGPMTVVSPIVAQLPVADATAAPVSTPQAELRAPRQKLEPRGPQSVSRVEPVSGPQPLFEHEKAEAHLFALPAKPPQPASRAALPGPSDSRRRSQISIGRIDVQVNNAPAPAEPAPRPTSTRSYSNFMEARYLNRFSLKP
jgi:hypothetical protein